MPTIKVLKVEDWAKVASTVVKTLKPGMILELSGPLGAGKTTFVQFLAKELGSKTEPKSPTFALVRRYAILNPQSSIRWLAHVDAYRIERPEDVLTLGLDELIMEPGTVVAIEWPEHLDHWLKSRKEPRLRLRIDLHRDGTRYVEVRG